jgi:hypothetical protein
MGVVYRARDEKLGRIVALKMVREGWLSTGAARSRFRTEAEAAAKLDHPAIVPIHEVGDERGQPYLTMKLVDGPNLAERAARRAMSPRESARLVATLARAVHYAHQRGVLHRDIKPTNVVLDAEGQPYLTDFGLAKLLAPGGEMTLTQVVMGTPGYMAPEQSGGGSGEVTTSVDVYALGVVLYELLCRRAPFRAKTAVETLRLVMESNPARPRSINPAVDDELETICLKCMEKEPARRYASAEALAEDLERWLRHEPIAARPAGLGRRVRQWARRNPALAAALVILAGSLCVVAAMLWKVSAEKRSKETAWVSEHHFRRRAEGAQQAARREKLLALAEARKSGAALFVQGLMLDASAPGAGGSAPGAAGGAARPLTVRELVRRAQERGEEAFKDRADARGALRLLLGTICLEQGMSAEAVVHLRRAVELAEPDEVDFDPESMEAMHQLGCALHEEGKLEEALWWLERAHRDRERFFGRDAEETKATRFRLADVLAALNRMGEAKPLLISTLGTRLGQLERELSGRRCLPDTLVATLASDPEVLEAAKKAYWAELAKLRGRRASDGRVAAVSYALALLDARGRRNLESAEAIFRGLLERWRDAPKVEMPAALLVTDDLADLLDATERADEADRLYEALIERRVELLGAAHAGTVAARAAAAARLDRVGRFDRAVLVRAPLVEHYATTLGTEHPATLECEYAQACSLRAAGQTDQALAAARAGLERAHRIGDTGSPLPGQFSALVDELRATAVARAQDVVITVVEGLAQIRTSSDGQWRRAEVGMVLPMGAEYRLGPRSSVVFHLGSGGTVTVDRLGSGRIESVLNSRLVGDRTRIQMKYGRTRYEIEARGAEPAVLTSPSATLSVRG